LLRSAAGAEYLPSPRLSPARHATLRLHADADERILLSLASCRCATHNRSRLRPAQSL
jgi:hypothetical protein